MKVSVYKISLDILESQSQYSLPMKKGDTSREIHITLRVGGMPYEIGEDCFAVFSGKKPDGKPLENNCVIKDNTIIYAITEQTTSASGLVDCEIKLYGAGSGLICSPRFSIIVDERVIGDEKIESTSEFSALTELYIDTKVAIEDAEAALKAAEEAVDQTYNPTSEKAQSGIAVSEVLNKGFDFVTKTNNILPQYTESGYYNTSLEKVANSVYCRTPNAINIDATKTRLYAYSKVKLTEVRDRLTIMFISSDGTYISSISFTSANTDEGVITIPTNATSFVAYIQDISGTGLTMENYCLSYTSLPNGYEKYDTIGKLKKSALPDNIKNVYYVSTNGNDENDGLTFGTPLATIEKACSLGATNIAIERGTYFVTSQIKFSNKNDVHIYAYDNDENYSHDAPTRKKATLVGGAYCTEYTVNDDGLYYCEGITSNYAVLMDNEETKAIILTLVSTYDECKTTDNSFYTDGTNLYFNTSNTTFTKIAVAKINTILTFQNCNNVLIEDVSCNVAISSVINMEHCSGVVMNNCEANYSIAGMGFALTDSNAIFNNCTAYRNKMDGFNFHGYGTTIMNECISKWNSDDGCSHHYGCIGTINGGRFTGNGKCGITPAYGATVNIYNAICDCNDNGGIGYLSTDNGHARMKGTVNGCCCFNNIGYGLRIQALCDVITINCSFKDISLGDIDNKGTLINFNYIDEVMGGIENGSY